jgi:hypothetical protein
MDKEKSDQEKKKFDDAMRGLIAVPMHEIVTEEKKFQQRKAKRQKRKKINR